MAGATQLVVTGAFARASLSLAVYQQQATRKRPERTFRGLALKMERNKPQPRRVVRNFCIQPYSKRSLPSTTSRRTLTHTLRAPCLFQDRGLKGNTKISIPLDNISSVVVLKMTRTMQDDLRKTAMVNTNELPVTAKGKFFWNTRTLSTAVNGIGNKTEYDNNRQAAYPMRAFLVYWFTVGSAYLCMWGINITSRE
ncbi:hypothetical protein KM043_013822 [Ampulex compressa]|nr:hypothetical protein KM043_013822 [Ampulex compressa]